MPPPQYWSSTPSETWIYQACLWARLGAVQDGEFHTRDPKLSNAEYIKSRLLNKESRFRKDGQYVFYLLSQKEKGEISAGVFNMLKCTSSDPCLSARCWTR